MIRLLLILLLSSLFSAAQMPPQAQQFIIFTNVTQGYTVPGKGAQATTHLVIELLGKCKAGGTTYLSEWSNIVAAYPFIGNTANSCRTNLVNLANTDAAFRLVFAGSPTIDLTEGVQWNGSTQYADMKVNPSLLSSVNMGLGIYSRTSMSAATKVAIGVTQDIGAQSYLVMNDATSKFRYALNTSSVPQVTSTTTTGWWYGSRISTSTINAYHNSSNLASTTFVNSQPNTTMYLGAAYYPTVSGASFFAAFHNVFAIVTINVNTDADEASIYNAIQDYETIMGRQMGLPILILIAMLSMFFGRPPNKETFWFVKVPSTFVESMAGKISNDNIFTYGVTLDGDTVTAASAENDFPSEFKQLEQSGYHIDSLLLSPEDFNQPKMK